MSLTIVISQGDKRRKREPEFAVSTHRGEIVPRGRNPSVFTVETVQITWKNREIK